MSKPTLARSSSSLSAISYSIKFLLRPSSLLLNHELVSILQFLHSNENETDTNKALSCFLYKCHRSWLSSSLSIRWPPFLILPIPIWNSQLSACNTSVDFRWNIAQSIDMDHSLHLHTNLYNMKY